MTNLPEIVQFSYLAGSEERILRYRYVKEMVIEADAEIHAEVICQFLE